MSATNPAADPTTNQDIAIDELDAGYGTPTLNEDDERPSEHPYDHTTTDEYGYGNVGPEPLGEEEPYLIVTDNELTDETTDTNQEKTENIPW